MAAACWALEQSLANDTGATDWELAPAGLAARRDRAAEYQARAAAHGRRASRAQKERRSPGAWQCVSQWPQRAHAGTPGACAYSAVAERAGILVLIAAGRNVDLTIRQILSFSVSPCGKGR